MLDSTKLFVLAKCNALPDDSQAFTSYSFATSEGGISLSLEHAAIFTSEEATVEGRNPWVVRQGGFKAMTLAEAIGCYVAYNIEANEYHNKD